MTASALPAPVPLQPPGLPVLGHLLPFARDPVGWLLAMGRAAPFVHLHLGPVRYLLVADPGAVRRILSENSRNWVRGPSYRVLWPVLGRGIVTTDGADWAERRRAVAPAFHRPRVDAAVGAVAAAADTLAARLGAGPVDIHRESLRFALDAFGRGLLGADLLAEVPTLAGAVSETIRFGNRYTNEPWPLPLWLPTPARLRFRRAWRTLRAAVERILARRDGDDAGLVALLADSAAHPDAAARAEEMTNLLLAGHETTANALSFAFAELARHPEWQARVREEAAGLEGPVDAAALARLPVATAVFQEALRLYPPVWFMERQALADDTLAGLPVPGGTVALVSPLVIHRHPSWWPDPDRFDPGRFLGRTIDRATWLPFIAGPHVCLGAHFALAQGALAITAVLRRHALAPVGPIPIEPALTLRPRDDLRIEVTGAP